MDQKRKLRHLLLIEKDKEREISVFRADKYFNMKLDSGSPRFFDTINMRKDYCGDEIRVDHLQRIRSGQPHTPSISSESSWTSQAALLPSSLTKSRRTKSKKVTERWLSNGVACNGSCYDERSVYTDKARRELHRREGTQLAQNPTLFEARNRQGMRFQGKEKVTCSQRYQTMSKVRENSGLHSLILQRHDEKCIIEPPRFSLEVFGSKAIKKEDIESNLERKLSVLSCDAIPNGHNITSTPESSHQVYEDMNSDASSDLFEIDSVSGNMHLHPIFKKQPIYLKSYTCTTPPSQYYEPSDTSNEWSVVTTSAAAADISNDSVNDATLSSVSKIRKSKLSGFLSCKAHKAVEISESAKKRK